MGKKGHGDPQEMKPGEGKQLVFCCSSRGNPENWIWGREVEKVHGQPVWSQGSCIKDIHHITSYVSMIFLLIIRRDSDENTPFYFISEESESSGVTAPDLESLMQTWVLREAERLASIPMVPGHRLWPRQGHPEGVFSVCLGTQRQSIR